MEITTTTVSKNPSRHAAVNALAIVGFIALILIGIGLAIYTTRVMPKLSSDKGGAAAFFSNLFHGDKKDPSLEVVTATSTLPAADTSDTMVVASSTTSTTVTATTSGTAHTSTHTTTVHTVTVTEPASLYGDPDLTVTITDAGYLRRDGDTDSFASANTIDNDRDAAIKFTVKNIGTNATGSWKFTANVPSSPSRTFTSPSQHSLNPGDSVDFVLGFEKARAGNGRDITVTVDSGKDVSESDERNNTDSRELDIRD